MECMCLGHFVQKGKYLEMVRGRRRPDQVRLLRSHDCRDFPRPLLFVHCIIPFFLLHPLAAQARMYSTEDMKVFWLALDALVVVRYYLTLTNLKS